MSSNGPERPLIRSTAFPEWLWSAPRKDIRHTRPPAGVTALATLKAHQRSLLRSGCDQKQQPSRKGQHPCRIVGLIVG
jgi:hypothetical protein